MVVLNLSTKFRLIPKLSIVLFKFQTSLNRYNLVLPLDSLVIKWMEGADMDNHVTEIWIVLFILTKVIG